MQEHKIMTYSVDELSETAHQNAIDGLRGLGLDVDHEWWTFDGLMDLSSEEIKARHMGKMEPKSPFRWDRLFFDLDRGQFIQFNGMNIEHDETARRFLRIPKDLWCACNPQFVNDGSRWNPRNTRLEFDADYYSERDFTPRELGILERAQEIFSDKVNEAWRILRDEYEYLTSDEAILESIRANEYEFTEDGSIF